MHPGGVQLPRWYGGGGGSTIRTLSMPLESPPGFDCVCREAFVIPAWIAVACSCPGLWWVQLLDTSVLEWPGRRRSPLGAVVRGGFGVRRDGRSSMPPPLPLSAWNVEARMHSVAARRMPPLLLRVARVVGSALPSGPSRELASELSGSARVQDGCGVSGGGRGSYALEQTRLATLGGCLKGGTSASGFPAQVACFCARRVERCRCFVCPEFSADAGAEAWAPLPRCHGSCFP